VKSAVNQVKSQRIASSLSWMIFILFVVVFVNMMELPRVPIEAPDKDALRNFHIATGSLLFACSCFRAYFWLQYPPQRKQGKLPIEAYNQLHILQFSLYCAFIQSRPTINSISFSLVSIVLLLVRGSQGLSPLGRMD